MYVDDAVLQQYVLNRCETTKNISIQQGVCVCRHVEIEPRPLPRGFAAIIRLLHGTLDPARCNPDLLLYVQYSAYHWSTVSQPTQRAAESAMGPTGYNNANS